MKTIILILLFSLSVFAQTQTTGRIAGTVKDQNGDLIVGANVTVTKQATGEDRTATTDEAGNFAFALLAPGVYQVRIEAAGFEALRAERIAVSITETTSLTAVLNTSGVVAEMSVRTDSPLIKTDSATIGSTFDARAVSELPISTRNFTQLLGLAPGTATYLADNTVVGRNTQNVSVNGARVSQNNFQLNGVDANAGLSFGREVLNPALESIAELKVQTSLFDATFGRSGGGNVQIVTLSGTNEFRGAIYGYFRGTALTANNPFLKSAGLPRPVLERSVYGGTFGGALRKNRAFFFVSYQGIRERNGASRLNSISSNVLIGTGGTSPVPLTDDRTETGLMSRFGVGFVHPTALRLLQERVPNGQFLIPTPQVGARYSGSAISSFREEQFNANFDYRVGRNNSLSLKFFFADAPQSLARNGVVNVPGFPNEQLSANALLSIQDVHSFSPNISNEARFGFNFLRYDNFQQYALSDRGIIRRSTSTAYPGLPNIRIAGSSGGIILGSGGLLDSNGSTITSSFTDTISISRGAHFIRAGGEIRNYRFNIDLPLQTRGSIRFPNFAGFLTGTTGQAILSTGITDRALRTTDYIGFVQDDWKISPKLTLTLGLRYELDMPPYDSRGRMSTFDPALYVPRLLSDGDRPIGPPISGIVQAGNAIAQYDLAAVDNVGKRVVKSIDPNNFAPRVGFAYSPFKSNRAVVRGGYGIFYSRASFNYLVNSLFSPPFYFTEIEFGSPLSDPFPVVPAQNEFPTLRDGQTLFARFFDRNMRTPYIQQFNLGVQYALSPDSVLEMAYVGSRGINLFRQVNINQAKLASEDFPVFNVVLDRNITTNAPSNAQLRAPFQGVGHFGQFTLDQTTAQSTYHSLQASLTRRLSRGLQFFASYTWSKSIDNASGTGGGSGTTGLTNTTESFDSAPFVGDQLDNRANRGLSNFDRKHRFVASFIWEVSMPSFVRRTKFGRALFTGWQMSGIVTAMSGLPIDIIDFDGGSFYLGTLGPGARPNWVPGVSATSNVPPGYYFNPFAFSRATVVAGQLIPSSGGSARAGAPGTDFGNVGRNPLRGPTQYNMDLSIGKRFQLSESRSIEFRAEFFNLLNSVNYANPISDLAAVEESGGTINETTGQIVQGSAGDFGKIISTSNNPRIMQVAVKFNF